MTEHTTTVSSGSPITRTLERLSDVKRTRAGWTARCPAHPDKNPSLSITEGNDGRVLLKCHAGCEIAAIVEAIGLSIPDLFRNAEETNGNTCTYDYLDTRGELLFQVVRKAPKGFQQRQPDGAGGWVWNMAGVQRVPYRLPELLAASASQPVFIVEGEKDVDRLRSLGLVATTNAGGACKWRDEYNEVLKGRDVVILPDNDRPGREHAEQVAKSVQGIASHVKTITLPGLEEKGDVSDWLNHGGSAEILHQLVAETPEWETPRAATAALAARPLAQQGEFLLAPYPLCVKKSPPTPYPIDALGPVLAPAARAIAAATEADLGVAAHCCLMAASMATQGLARVRLPFGATRPLGLFLITIADSGERKTAADELAMRAVLQHEAERIETFGSERRDWNLRKEIYDAQVQQIKNDKRGKLTQADKLAAIRELENPGLPPYSGACLTDDTTIEGFVNLLYTGWPYAGINASDGATFTGGYAMNDESRRRTGAALSALWDKGEIHRTRAGEAYAIKGASVSVHIQLQREAAREFLGDNTLMDQGLFSRVLTAEPPRPIRTGLAVPSASENATIEKFANQLLALLRKQDPGQRGEQKELPTIAMDNEAVERWTAFSQRMAVGQNPDGEFEGLSNVINKLPENVARISAVLTLLEDRHSVSSSQMGNAIRLAEHYLETRIGMNAGGQLSPKLQRAERTLKWLHKSWAKKDEARLPADLVDKYPPDCFTISTRELYSNGSSTVRSKDNATHVLRTLCDHLWATECVKTPDRWIIRGPEAEVSTDEGPCGKCGTCSSASTTDAQTPKMAASGREEALAGADFLQSKGADELVEVDQTYGC